MTLNRMVVILSLLYTKHRRKLGRRLERAKYPQNAQTEKLATLKYTEILQIPNRRMSIINHIHLGFARYDNFCELIDLFNRKKKKKIRLSDI